MIGVARMTRNSILLVLGMTWPVSGQVSTTNSNLQLGSSIVGRHQQLVLHYGCPALAFSDSSVRTLYLSFDDEAVQGTADDRIPISTAFRTVTFCRNSPSGLTVFDGRIAIVFSQMCVGLVTVPRRAENAPMRR